MKAKYYLKVLSILIITFFNCTNSRLKTISIQIEDVTLLYTKPNIVSNLDSVIKFKSEVYVQVGTTIRNKTSKKIELIFNNLRNSDYSFDLVIDMDGNNTKVYNYPFSNYSFPVKNRNVLNPHDSIYVKFETPFIYSSINFQIHKIDSLLNEIKNSKFKIEEVTDQKNEYRLDHSNITYFSEPVNYR